MQNLVRVVVAVALVAGLFAAIQFAGISVNVVHVGNATWIGIVQPN